MQKSIPVYEARILFRPNRKPNAKNYILWINYINLTDSSRYNRGSFAFNYRSDNIGFIFTTCSVLSIVSPVISTFIDRKQSKLKKDK